ncbi:MAG: FtsQ-type POTRA domain-containing protein [Desulfuromonadaceae bacterium]|nr:FtsQ-type POTRA domain-containing protein [Desulfuromonadaceae bacterium]
MRERKSVAAPATGIRRKGQGANRRRKAPRDWKKVLSRLFRGLLMVVCAVLLTAGVVLLVHLLSVSEHFRVDQIRVEGNHHLSQDEVIALSDIRQGTRTFDLNLELIGQKLAETDWIAAASVERQLPRGIVIRIRERQVAYILNLDFLYYVDQDGTIFKVLQQGDGLDYPLVSGLSREQLLEQPEPSRQWLQQVAALLEVLRSRSIFGLDEVGQVRIDFENGLELYTRHYGVPVRIGKKDYASKIDHLEQIYPRLQPRLATLAYIDLNVPEKVIVKYMME